MELKGHKNLFYLNVDERNCTGIVLPFEICDTINMDEAIRAELDKLTELIINAIPVEKIYLFGSYAYGKPHKYSDLDLYVVLKDDISMRDLTLVCKSPWQFPAKSPCPLILWQKRKGILTADWTA
jgi:hypothetical protein